MLNVKLLFGHKHVKNTLYGISDADIHLCWLFDTACYIFVTVSK